jgi:hypothetical protein
MDDYAYEINAAYDYIEVELEDAARFIHRQKYPEYVRFSELCKSGILEDVEAYYDVNKGILATDFHQNNTLFWDCVYLKLNDVAICIYSLKPFELKIPFGTNCTFLYYIISNYISEMVRIDTSAVNI